MQLWVIKDGEQVTGAIVTEIYPTAAGLTCALPVVGGVMGDGVMEAMSRIESWAREQGCVRLRGEGRAGWERALKPYGWSKKTTVIEKQL